MIRRNITLDDGTAAWLLVSQVEHARISGELTSAWRDVFAEEVVDAITHHDDGWAAWETSPQMDATRGRPLSFLEMPIEDALRIWDGSIAAARKFGPLAGAIVAGHFLGLASGSEHAAHPIAAVWLRDTEATRAAWLDEWQLLSSSNALDTAVQSQRMLLTADLLSLWLCCDGPVANVDAGEIPNAEMKSRTAAVLGTYHFAEGAKSVAADSIDWLGSLGPWPFTSAELRLASPAMIAPIRKYATWAELSAASRPIALRWRLRETLPGPGEC